MFFFWKAHQERHLIKVCQCYMYYGQVDDWKETFYDQ